MPDDPIPSDSGAGSERKKPVVCEFCGCRLTATGEVLGMSAAARKMRDAEDRLEDAVADVTRLVAEVSDLKEKLAVATKPADKPSLSKDSFL